MRGARECSELPLWEKPLLRSMLASRGRGMLPRHPAPRHRSFRKLHAPGSSLGLPLGPGRARRSGPKARGPAGRQLRPPGRSGRVRREGRASLPRFSPRPRSPGAARSPRGARIRAGRAGTCAGACLRRARGQGERASSCAQCGQRRRRSHPGAPRHKD